MLKSVNDSSNFNFQDLGIKDNFLNNFSSNNQISKWQIKIFVSSFHPFSKYYLCAVEMGLLNVVYFIYISKFCSKNSKANKSNCEWIKYNARNNMREWSNQEKNRMNAERDNRNSKFANAPPASGVWLRQWFLMNNSCCWDKTKELILVIEIRYTG